MWTPDTVISAKAESRVGGPSRFGGAVLSYRVNSRAAGSIRQPISHYYGASTIFSSERTVRQFRMVLAVCSCAARYSFVSLLRATPLG